MPFFYIPDSGSLCGNGGGESVHRCSFGDNFQFATHIQDVVLSSVELGVLGKHGQRHVYSAMQKSFFNQLYHVTIYFGGRPLPNTG